MYQLLCLEYFSSALIHNMMPLTKTIKTTNLYSPARRSLLAVVIGRLALTIVPSPLIRATSASGHIDRSSCLSFQLVASQSKLELLTDSPSKLLT